MRIFILVIVCSAVFSVSVFADGLTREDRNELFDSIERMCADADATVSKYIKFEGDAGAKGVLKLVGASVSGAVTIEQYENLEHQLNDFRANPTICKFEAFKLLLPLFGGDGDAAQIDSIESSIQYVCTMIERSRVRATHNDRRIRTPRQAEKLLNAVAFDVAKNYSKLYIADTGAVYYKNLSGDLVATDETLSDFAGPKQKQAARDWGLNPRKLILFETETSEQRAPLLDVIGIDQKNKTSEFAIIVGLADNFDLGLQFHLRTRDPRSRVVDRVQIYAKLGECTGASG